mgnify:CR=1 FL=1
MANGVRDSNLFNFPPPPSSDDGGSRSRNRPSGNTSDDNFMVRIVLRDEESPAYDDLHDKMSLEGFNKFVVGQNEKRYALPDAEYHYVESSASQEEVFELARRAAKKVSDNFGIVVAKVEGTIGFYGLQEI